MSDSEVEAQFAKLHFETYIVKVLRQVHPDIRIAADTKKLINLYVIHIGTQISSMASAERVEKNMKTLTSEHMQEGTREYLADSGDILKHAVSEGARAVVKYNSSLKNAKARKERGEPPERMPQQQRAGLLFPFARTKQLIRQTSCTCKLNADAIIFLAAVLEYITAEILELAGNVTRDAKRVTIAPKDVTKAVTDDKEVEVAVRAYYEALEED